MTKLVLDPMASGASVAVINENFQKISDELQNKVLYRNNTSGETNSLSTDLDTNGKRVYNLPAPTSASEAARLQDVTDAIASANTAVLTSFSPVGTISSTNVQGAIQEVVSDLASSSGSSLVGFIQAGTGAVATTSQNKHRETVSVLDFGADNTGATDARAACQAAINYVVSLGGGKVYFPRGTYLLSGVASSDTTLNGLLIPDTNGSFGTGYGVTLYGDGVETLLKAGSNDMFIIRNSRLCSTIKELSLTGIGKTGVIGIGAVPESLTQTTELVSQSFMHVDTVWIDSCRRGMQFQPGPTVLGADSGCFYHSINNLRSNLCDEHVFMSGDVTGMLNRTTRTTFKHCVFLRGNTGVNIIKGTEIDFVSCFFELINTGVTPSATPVAFIYADPNPAGINLIGGYAEACTRGVVATTSDIAATMTLNGFQQSMAPDSSEAFMGKFNTKKITISKPIANEAVSLSFGNPTFVSLIVDPLAANSKTLDVQINGATKARWSSAGSFTHYGSSSNIALDSLGSSITFSGTGSNNISNPSGAAQVNYCDSQYWRSGAGADVMRLATTGTLSLFPSADNSVVLGQNGLRWSAVWAANGVIQTSDPRTKKDISASSLGLDFVMKLKPVQYKFISGGNKIVGVREITPAISHISEDGELIIDKNAEVENVIEEIAGVRQHFGFLTTDVKEAIGNVDFGGYIKSDMNNPESIEALRYDEFIAPIVAAIQELNNKIAALELKVEVDHGT